MEYSRINSKRFVDELRADPGIYDHVIVTVFDPPEKLEAALSTVAGIRPLAKVTA